MKNNVEIRPNGLKITKKMCNRYPMYFVAGSKNGPWDYLANARKDADTAVSVGSAIDAMQCGATHYHVMWRQYLKVVGESAKVYIDGTWVEARGQLIDARSGYTIDLKKVV